jgi:adenylylsulfate kinase-like enzyme
VRHPTAGKAVGDLGADGPTSRSARAIVLHATTVQDPKAYSMVVFTGLPGTGESTLAERVASDLLNTRTGEDAHGLRR